MDENELKQKEKELAEREARLKDAEDKIVRKGAKERFYDKIKVPVKYIDIFIGVCVAGIFIFLLLGFLKGHGMI